LVVVIEQGGRRHAESQRAHRAFLLLCRLSRDAGAIDGSLWLEAATGNHHNF
jgi:hypothetical protein